MKKYFQNINNCGTLTLIKSQGDITTLLTVNDNSLSFGKYDQLFIKGLFKSEELDKITQQEGELLLALTKASIQRDIPKTGWKGINMDTAWMVAKAFDSEGRLWSYHNSDDFESVRVLTGLSAKKIRENWPELDSTKEQT